MVSRGPIFSLKNKFSESAQLGRFSFGSIGSLENLPKFLTILIVPYHEVLMLANISFEIENL